MLLLLLLLALPDAPRPRLSATCARLTSTTLPPPLLFSLPLRGFPT